MCTLLPGVSMGFPVRPDHPTRDYFYGPLALSPRPVSAAAAQWGHNFRSLYKDLRAVLAGRTFSFTGDAHAARRRQTSLPPPFFLVKITGFGQRLSDPRHRQPSRKADPAKPHAKLPISAAWLGPCTDLDPYLGYSIFSRPFGSPFGPRVLPRTRDGWPNTKLPKNWKLNTEWESFKLSQNLQVTWKFSWKGV